MLTRAFQLESRQRFTNRIDRINLTYSLARFFFFIYAVLQAVIAERDISNISRNYVNVLTAFSGQD